MTTIDQAPESPAKAPRKIRVLPIALFLLVPTLYVFGRSYWDAWLSEFGLTQATFPLSVDQAIYKSYEAMLWAGISTLPLIAKASLLVLALIVMWVVIAVLLLLWGLIQEGIRKLLAKIITKIDSFITKHRSKLELSARSYGIAATPFMLLGAIFFVFLLLLLPIVIGGYAGKWQGQKNFSALQARITANEFTDREQLIITDSDDSLRLVACGDLGCAGASREGVQFIRWDRINRLEHASKRLTSED